MRSMSTLILDGTKVRDFRMKKLQSRVAPMAIKPALAIIQVGKRPDSTAFINAKKAFAQKIGVPVLHIELSDSVSSKKVIETIEKLNRDKKIKGIIVQLPLPEKLDKDLIINTIYPTKDVDGLTTTNVKSWLEGNKKGIMPTTARGIRTLLQYYKISLEGKDVVVIGRSMLVGKPIASMCLSENATVTICHSKTKDLKKETIKADVVISATGHPHLIGPNHIKRGTVVIDVGIIRQKDCSLIGDVDFAKVSKKASAITPVPGGVGPMTVCSIFENLLDM